MISTYNNDEKKYNIEMSESEAFVLYEFIYQNINKLNYANYSEKKVLLQLQGVIENKLPYIFAGNFPEKLKQAIEDVHGKDETDDSFWKH